MGGTYPMSTDIRRLNFPASFQIQKQRRIDTKSFAKSIRVLNGDRPRAAEDHRNQALARAKHLRDSGLRQLVLFHQKPQNIQRDR